MRHRGRVGRALRLTALLAGGLALVLVSTIMVSIPAAGPRRLIAGRWSARRNG